MISEYWIVVDKRTGKVIAQCGDISDAIMMVSFDSNNRHYQRQRFLLDQVIDITSTTDKQLPGQIGLPSGKTNALESKKNILPQNEQQPIII